MFTWWLHGNKMVSCGIFVKWIVGFAWWVYCEQNIVIENGPCPVLCNGGVDSESMRVSMCWDLSAVMYNPDIGNPKHFQYQQLISRHRKMNYREIALLIYETAYLYRKLLNIKQTEAFHKLTMTVTVETDIYFIDTKSWLMSHTNTIIKYRE